jgi:hypothetical protein
MTLSNQSHFPRWRTAVFLMLWCLKGGAYSPAGKGLGESQFRRLEKKLSTLPTLWALRILQREGWGGRGGWREQRNHRRWLTGAWPIPAYDKPESGRFRLVVSRSRPGPGKSSPVIRWRRKVILKNPKRRFDEASCIKSSSGDVRFRLVVSRNWPGSGKSSPGDWKIAGSDFGWTKSS